MVVFRIIRNLFLKFLAVLLGPLHFLWGPIFSIGVPVFGLWFFYMLFTGGFSKPHNTSFHASGDLAHYESTKTVPVLVEEDGNSLYSTNLWTKMHKDEKAYYSYIFSWVMKETEGGMKQPWKKYNIGGSITPDVGFTNGTGKTCRRFEEVLKVHEIQQTISGIGCEDGKGGWCKLRSNDAPTCNIGYMSDWERTKQQWGIKWRSMF